ncbi:MAG: S8 family serine peptidase, partial [Candidatus Poseidoniales archaeon]|nr:S8 family serine peptidase [Candidatus Poseidoniales archaeon]
MTRALKTVGPMLVVALMLILDLSAGVTAIVPRGDNINQSIDYGSESKFTQTSLDIPELKCQGEVCPEKYLGIGFPPWDAGSAVEEPYWWVNFATDRDSNGMEDSLQYMIDGQKDSHSATAILGNDGRMTTAIIVGYSWHPGETDLTNLKEILIKHGWEEEGSWFFPVDYIDSVVIDHVPVSSLIEIWQQDGVIMIEEQDKIVSYLSVATRGSKVRDSDVYDETLRDFGYDGSGVVIAVLDSGVDNEHFSLDDFSDNNNNNENQPDDLSDPKWVAGCDATSWNSQECNDGEFDPDDGNGHGTHVAGIALGTGDDRRVNQGYAPGSYLVDVKVMTDSGGSAGGDEGPIIKGLQWVLQNVNTDWGNNDSSEGIDIMTMSFGSGSSPAGGNDQGDDGNNSAARLVNDCAEAGIVPIAAIGNDGTNRVTSVGAADSAITVGAIDDQNTIQRNDDDIADYSNSGPRVDDNDEDKWDELKPDVVAPGSGITSAQHAASSSTIPGQDSTSLADDGYVSMDGTSMSTPAVAGLVAVILQIDDELEPQEVKDILRNNSEVRGSPSMPSVSDIWNDKYGFGIIDGNLILQALLGDGTGGGGPPDNGTGGPPVGEGTGNWAAIEKPSGLWLIEGESYSVRGHITDAGEENGSTEEVQVRVTYKYRPTGGGPLSTGVLVDWHQAFGTVNWTTNFDLPNFEDDEEVDAETLQIEVKSRNEFEQWSNTTKNTHNIGKISLEVSSPSSQDIISGNIEVSGVMETVNGAQLQWRLGTDNWKNMTYYSGNGNEEIEWAIPWDTRDTDDGIQRFSVRFVSGVGVASEEIRTTIEIDNNPPSPDLMFRTGVSIQEYGIVVTETYVNTFLEAKVQIRNIGDLSADELSIYLLEDGFRKDEIIIQSIGSGDIIEISLSWNPSTVGEKLLTISLDPLDDIQENNESDNDISIIFPVLQRPQGIDLAFREGAVKTEPSIPRPNEQFLITGRIDNLGSSDATGVSATLWLKNELGWMELSSTTISLVVGQGASQVAFAHIANEVGPLEIKITIQGESLSDLNWDNNEVISTILIDQSVLSGARKISFNYGEEPIKIIDLNGEGLVITSKEGGLALYRLNSNLALVPCSNMLETKWSGDFTSWSTSDGYAHVAWTRRYIDNQGYFLQTLSYSRIDATCEMSPIQDLMESISLSDGKYYGIDIDVKGTEIMIGGYHRDISTGGTYQDLTSIFLLTSDYPTSSSDWDFTPNIIGEIEINMNEADAVVVEFGEEYTHILYQSNRDDITSEERLGLWYAHGSSEQASWTYRKAIGDTAGMQMMSVKTIDDKDYLFVVWKEGIDSESKLIAMIADSTMSPRENLSMEVSSKGIGKIQMTETHLGIQVFYDFVGPTGSQIQYGMMSPIEDNQWIGLSDRITSGKNHLSSADRSPLSDQTILLSWNELTGWEIRALIDDSDPDKGDLNLLDELRIYLGLDEQNFAILMSGIAITVLLLCLIVLSTMSVNAVKWAGRKRRKVIVGNIILEDDVVDIVEPSDIEIKSSEIELIDMELTEGSNIRKERRQERMNASSVNEETASNTPEIIMPPPVNTTFPIPQINLLVVCPDCSSRFEVSIGLKMIKCPICDVRIDL